MSAQPVVTMDRQANVVPMLGLVLPDTGPLEEAKVKIDEISKVLWYIHQWQDEESDVEDLKQLSRMLRKEACLKKKQIKILKTIGKKTPEHEVIKTVKIALYGSDI